MARAMAMAMAMAMARTTDSLVRARARAKGLGLGLGSVFTFKRPDRFCRRTKFNVTVLAASSRTQCAILYCRNIDCATAPRSHGANMAFYELT